MKKAQKVKLKDIAEASGVAVTTASAALNHTGRVSEELRQKILRVSRQMNYEPNIAAQLLKQKNCSEIGLIITDIPERIFGSGYFQPIIANFIRQCEEENLRCQIEYHNPVSLKDEIPSLLTNGFAGGVLHAGTITPGLRNWLKKNPDFPFVAFQEDYKYNITSNYDEAFYKGIQYIVALGHRNFGLVSGPVKYSLQKQIKDGFMRAVSDFELETRDEWKISLDLERDIETIEDTVKWGRELFKQSEIPSAIICCDGRAVKGLLHAACEAGIRVPEDLSILACSSKNESEQVYPALSSVCWNAQEAIFKGIYMLQSLMRKNNLRNRRLVIEPIMEIRKSITKFSGRQ
jgi:DNA-binding LacI/PurR family transcriptional regulator